MQYVTKSLLEQYIKLLEPGSTAYPTRFKS